MDDGLVLVAVVLGFLVFPVGWVIGRLAVMPLVWAVKRLMEGNDG